MKKYSILKIIPLLVILIFFSSCSHYKAINGQRGEGDKRSLAKVNITSFDPKHYERNKKYGVALSVLKNDDMSRPEDNERWIKSLKINYPQIYNLEDTDKEERLNEVLYKEAINICDAISNRDYTEFNIDYKIMEANDNILSILFTGFIYDHQHANSIAYAVTIDLSKERFVNLSNYFKIDSKFADKHLHKDFKVIKNNFNNLNENNTFVEEYVKNYNRNKHTHDFYIKNGTLGLIIPAPQAMGYIILEGEIGSKQLDK